MTPSCGLEEQKTTQAFNSATDPNNTFDLISKCKTTVYLIYFSWYIYRDEIKSKVLFGSVAELNAWVVFCTSSPQLGVIYQL
jgi:hypothetical protein